MATFSNTPINIVKVDTTSTGTAYTVPAGAYAEVRVLGYNIPSGSVNMGGRPQIDSTFLPSFPGGSTSTNPGSESALSRDITLRAGDTIELFGTITSFTVVIIEYALP
ncbi:MAG: hypothetical protein HRT70_10610 [Flavobacteriaceae bacterium]|nr:hypothetical protein [Flavobacteriaceae bacterium]